MAEQLLNQFVEGEAGGGGFPEQARDKGPEPAVVLVAGTRLSRRRPDERTYAAARLEDAGTFELAVDAGHRVGVDSQLDRQFPDRRQLIARPQPPRGNRCTQTAFELGVNRRRVAGIEGNESHRPVLSAYTSSLVQPWQPGNSLDSAQRGSGPGPLYSGAMQEVVFTRYGPPEVLNLRRSARAELRPGEVRITVSRSGVNFADVMARMGLYPDAPKPPLVLGYEVAGVVAEVAADVAQPRIGERVVALTRFGGYASEVTVSAAYAFPIPSGVNDAEAVALPVNYLTASLALYRLANVTAGETVLIHGAGGGVGIAATQLARMRRARIIGTASAAKHEAIRLLGVDHPIDYRHDDVAREVRRLTNGRGVDVVLDPIGGKSFETSYRLLAPLGRLVVYGVSAVAPGTRRNWWHAARAVLAMPRFKPLSLMNRNKGVFGLNLAHLWDEREQLAAAMQSLLHDLQEHRLQPVVAKAFPLEHAAEAHRFLQSRSNIGKVILTVPTASV